MRRPVHPAAIAALCLVAAAPAAAQIVESQVRSLAEDENEIVEYNLDCDPSPHADPIEFGCSCEVSGVYGEDEKCLADRHLHRFTNLPGERLRQASFSCDADSCVFIPPAMPPDEALAIAETDYGFNFVDVSSMGHAADYPWI